MFAKLIIGLALVAGVFCAEKVKISLYYETLCPYCIDFVEDQLYPTYQKISDIMEYEMFPYGNANYKANGDGWSFTCQHGTNECIGNTIHACFQKYNTDVDKEIEFAACLIKNGHAATNGAKCAEQVMVDYAPIGNCADSVEGENALHEVALIQEQLDPSLYFTPWILVDDIFSEDQVGDCQTDLLKVVCDRYQGTKPAACN